MRDNTLFYMLYACEVSDNRKQYYFLSESKLVYTEMVSK